MRQTNGVGSYPYSTPICAVTNAQLDFVSATADLVAAHPPFNNHSDSLPEPGGLLRNRLGHAGRGGSRNQTRSHESKEGHRWVAVAAGWRHRAASLFGNTDREKR